jgi:hypothetical protein
MHDGAPARFSRAVRDALSNICHDRRIGRGCPTAWPPSSMPDFSPLDFYLLGYLNPLMNAAPVENEETHTRNTVDACQTIRNYPGTSERMRRSKMRTVMA